MYLLYPLEICVSELTGNSNLPEYNLYNFLDVFLGALRLCVTSSINVMSSVWKVTLSFFYLQTSRYFQHFLKPQRLTDFFKLFPSHLAVLQFPTCGSQPGNVS